MTTTTSKPTVQVSIPFSLCEKDEAFMGSLGITVVKSVPDEYEPLVTFQGLKSSIRTFLYDTIGSGKEVRYAISQAVNV
jgi:hypothetical protein